MGERLLPKLDMRMSWILSMAVTSGVIGSVAAKVLSGKYPWQWLEEDKDSNIVRETMHPRAGGVDYHNLPIRFTLPTYWKDVEHMQNPRQYVTSSLSGTMSKGIDEIGRA